MKLKGGNCMRKNEYLSSSAMSSYFTLIFNYACFGTFFHKLIAYINIYFYFSTCTSLTSKVLCQRTGFPLFPDIPADYILYFVHRFLWLNSRAFCAHSYCPYSPLIVKDVTSGSCDLGSPRGRLACLAQRFFLSLNFDRSLFSQGWKSNRLPLGQKGIIPKRPISTVQFLSPTLFQMNFSKHQVFLRSVQAGCLFQFHTYFMTVVTAV